MVLFGSCLATRTLSEMRWPIYREPSTVLRVMWRQRLLSEMWLEKLQQVLELHGYDALNFVRCMTLDVENIHPVVHHKDPLSTLVDYAKNFGNAAKEGLKRTTHLFYKSKVLVSACTRTCHVCVGHACYITLANCANDTTVRASYEGLGTDVWYCSASALCQTRDNNDKSRNPAFLLYQREVRPGESVSLERSGEQQRNEAEEAGEEDGILEYDSSSSEDLDDGVICTNNDRAAMMFVEFRRWIARQLLCLERFHVSEELSASVAEL